MIMSSIVPRDDNEPWSVFDALGHNLRFGVTDDDRIYVVASDIATAMGYRDAFNAIRILEDDEAGTHIVSTRSVTSVVQRREVSVIYEDGIWELIFRSSRPGAKLIKKRVKEILREIRRTGRYEVSQDADAWRTLASGQDNYSVRTVAAILKQDTGITITERQLFRLFKMWGWTYGRHEPYARVARYAVKRIYSDYRDQETKELRSGGWQLRITVEGVAAVRRKLRGVAAIADII
jgi:prophage antirepressor-like protein